MKASCSPFSLDDVVSRAISESITTHSNSSTPHGLQAIQTALALADSKTGIWTVGAADTFSGPDGSPLGNAETGGQTWLTNGIQRIGGRAKQPADAFDGALVDVGFSDGQVEADLFPGSGEASLIIRSNSIGNQYFLLQRGGDGTVRLTHNYTSSELLAPLASLPVVPGERWKARCVGSRIYVLRVLDGAETLVFDVTDTRLGNETRFGIRLNGTGAIDNLRVLKREAI